MSDTTREAVAEAMWRVLHNDWGMYQHLDREQERDMAADLADAAIQALTEETRTVRSICDMADPGIPERRWVTDWVPVRGEQ